MKFLKIILILLAPVLLNSCATILTSSEQEVVLTTPTKAKLYIDSVFIDSGNTINAILFRDLNEKQIRLEADGYQTGNFVVMQNSKSNWNILSYFMGLYPAVYDIGRSSWTFEDEFSFKSLYKYPIRDSNMKNISIRNISLKTGPKQSSVQVYSYSDFLKKKAPDNTEYLDSVSNQYFDYVDDFEEILKKYNFIDTINTSFIDNVNSLTLNAEIKKVTFKHVRNEFNQHPTLSFREIDLVTNWHLLNSYKDTIATKTIESTSGQYTRNRNSNKSNEQISSDAIKDALEKSFIIVFDSLNQSHLLKKEDVNVMFADKVKITKPSKQPTNINEAMKATVIVKGKDGHGSGFFVSNDGYLVTNHHVVSKNSDYKVILNDGTELTAKIIRSNKAIDLALLKVESNQEYAFILPEKQNYNVGDEILAIGAPKSIQLGQSVSKGIVSGVRKNKGMNYLQTDIKINGGNSGGPIVLKNGELTSVVQYKIVGGNSEGLSFSIPAYDIIPSLFLTY